MKNNYGLADLPWQSHIPWVSCRDQRSRRSLPAEGPSRSEAQKQSSASDAKPNSRCHFFLDVAIYLDDQVNIWRGVGDGKDGGPGQGGGIHVRGVRFEEIFKLLRVEIVVKVLRYLWRRRIQSQTDWLTVVMHYRQCWEQIDSLRMKESHRRLILNYRFYVTFTLSLLSFRLSSIMCPAPLRVTWLPWPRWRPAVHSCATFHRFNQISARLTTQTQL